MLSLTHHRLSLLILRNHDAGNSCTSLCPLTIARCERAAMKKKKEEEGEGGDSKMERRWQDIALV